MKKIMGLKANVKLVEHAPVGRHQIEGVVGLYLHVGERNARWLFRYHRADGRPTETGLGSTRDVSLKEAVERAHELRKLVKQGIDPVGQRRQQKLQARTDSVNGTTLRDVLDAYREAKGDARGVKVTVALVERHAAQLLPSRVIAIDAAQIMKALAKVQAATPKTGRRVLAAIATVLDFVAVMELVPKDRKNPAQWRGGFQHLWPRPPAKTHHQALPYADAPSLFAPG